MNNVVFFLQILICLHFFATGSIQWVTANDYRHRTVKSSVSRIIRRVTNSIITRMRRYIHFPSSQEEILAAKMGFMEKAGLPGCIGAIDCTHIPIQKPSTPDAHVYLNRKGRYSINIQLVSPAHATLVQWLFSHNSITCSP